MARVPMEIYESPSLKRFFTKSYRTSESRLYDMHEGIRESIFNSLHVIPANFEYTEPGINVHMDTERRSIVFTIDDDVQISKKMIDDIINKPAFKSEFESHLPEFFDAIRKSDIIDMYAKAKAEYETNLRKPYDQEENDNIYDEEYDKAINEIIDEISACYKRGYCKDLDYKEFDVVIKYKNSSKNPEIMARSRAAKELVRIARMLVAEK